MSHANPQTGHTYYNTPIGDDSLARLCKYTRIPLCWRPTRPWLTYPTNWLCDTSRGTYNMQFASNTPTHARYRFRDNRDEPICARRGRVDTAAQQNRHGHQSVYRRAPETLVVRVDLSTYRLLVLSVECLAGVPEECEYRKLRELLTRSSDCVDLLS